jgi:hypothetical protein
METIEAKGQRKMGPERCVDGAETTIKETNL